MVLWVLKLGAFEHDEEVGQYDWLSIPSLDILQAARVSRPPTTTGWSCICIIFLPQKISKQGVRFRFRFRFRFEFGLRRISRYCKSPATEALSIHNIIRATQEDKMGFAYVWFNFNSCTSLLRFKFFPYAPCPSGFHWLVFYYFIFSTLEQRDGLAVKP